jgi:DNA-binding NtrC family response regulator
MKEAHCVLVIDDEAIVGERLKPVLEENGYQVETCTQSDLAVKRLMEKNFHVVITDLKMSGPSGMDILRLIKERSPGTQVILITGYGSIEDFREAEMIGVFSFISKPFAMKELVKLVNKADRKASQADPC